MVKREETREEGNESIQACQSVIFLLSLHMMQLMRQYELALVVSPTVDEKQVKTLKEKVTDLVKAEKGKVKSADNFPKRALTYPILKQKEASFEFLKFEAPTLSKGFNLKVKRVEGVLRYLLLKS